MHGSNGVGHEKRNIQTIAGFAREGAQTEPQLRWQVFNATHNGLEEFGAVVRIGRRVYLDVDRYWQWVNSGRASQRPVAA